VETAFSRSLAGRAAPSAPPPAQSTKGLFVTLASHGDKPCPAVPPTHGSNGLCTNISIALAVLRRRAPIAINQRV
jgi:hypothetical protein